MIRIFSESSFFYAVISFLHVLGRKLDLVHVVFEAATYSRKGKWAWGKNPKTRESNTTGLPCFRVPTIGITSLRASACTISRELGQQVHIGRGARTRRR